MTILMEKLTERNRRKAEILDEFKEKHAFVFFFGGLVVSLLIGVTIGLLLATIL